MFRLPIGRHRLGAGGDRGETALRERIATLETELAKCKALAERRAHLITMLGMGCAGLILAVTLAMAVHTAPVRQAGDVIAQALAPLVR
jgi:hypothetical protein